MKNNRVFPFLRGLRLVLSIVMILLIIGGLVTDRFAVWG